jgi:hypothetical protein
MQSGSFTKAISRQSFRQTSRYEKEELLMPHLPYRDEIGVLTFLSVRPRPEIAVAVGTLAMHVQQPLPKHWEALKRVLRYFRGSIDDGLVL